MRRLGRSRRSDALAERIHAPLERIARASTRRVLSVPRVALTAAYLVDEARVDDFRAAVEELDERVAEAAILCTGPWPPYSFAPSEGGA
jgi:Gas vesicle synthesis protein GvpL/GvpF